MLHGGWQEDYQTNYYSRHGQGQFLQGFLKEKGGGFELWGGNFRALALDNWLPLVRQLKMDMQHG